MNIIFIVKKFSLYILYTFVCWVMGVITGLQAWTFPASCVSSYYMALSSTWTFFILYLCIDWVMIQHHRTKEELFRKWKEENEYLKYP